MGFEIIQWGRGSEGGRDAVNLAMMWDCGS